MTATQTEVSCPKCGGAMWDNRLNKKNPKAPDFKCRNKSCDGVIWPPRNPKNARPVQQAPNIGPPIAGLDDDDLPPPVDEAYGEQTVIVQSAKLDALAAIHTACFEHAVELAKDAIRAGIPVTGADVSALTAQVFIAATSR